MTKVVVAQPSNDRSSVVFYDYIEAPKAVSLGTGHRLDGAADADIGCVLLPGWGEVRSQLHTRPRMTALEVQAFSAWQGIAGMRKDQHDLPE